MLFNIRDNPVCDSDVSLFGVASGDGKCVLGPRNTHLESQKYDCCIDNGDLFCQGVGKIYSRGIHTKTGPIIH